MYTKSSQRTDRYSGASGSAGDGAPPSLPLLFSQYHHHDIDNPLSPPLALARVGGEGGPVFVYSDEPLMGATQGGCTSFAGGGRQDSLTSYLFPFSQRSFPGQQHISSVNGRLNNALTPPSSFSPNMTLPLAMPCAPMSLPLTPESSSSPVHRSASMPSITETRDTPVPLISALFPYHATMAAQMSHRLEIVTPPDHVLQGFILDHPECGRAVYIHLPPPHVSASDRPEYLAPHFSAVLRPHDPKLSTSPEQASSLQALDIRESLTALLDLASDSLKATSLILVLDQDDRGQEGLGDLLHSLMYVGGQVVKPGMLEGGWEWDPRRWVLVGMEL
ncbi:ornithine decarboxylase antizyme-domain-containing protein [Naematelia encephala]|uniref:Ornithine decarboxylase antizyme-domain-containing protein n=1 Tax=Naematelia encephala TaxID=71784 RepID=A0A1Y2B9R7_9TREE|nr:ornithine decarboxylase antizyme-domain-containing protein [Naematelia encephala]